MPQLLSHLRVDANVTIKPVSDRLDAPIGVDPTLDWGILTVYTCKKNCKGTKEGQYFEEFLWKQNMS